MKWYATGPRYGNAQTHTHTDTLILDRHIDFRLSMAYIYNYIYIYIIYIYIFINFPHRKSVIWWLAGLGLFCPPSLLSRSIFEVRNAWSGQFFSFKIPIYLLGCWHGPLSRFWDLAISVFIYLLILGMVIYSMYSKSHVSARLVRRKNQRTKILWEKIDPPWAPTEQRKMMPTPGMKKVRAVALMVPGTTLR